MKRYVISLLVFLAGIWFTIASGPNSIMTFLDLPSFIIVGIFPFLFVRVDAGVSGTKIV